MSSSHRSNIRNPYANGTSAKRQRTEPCHQNRCVLLFDMDCFYAQCERVRLGLPMDVKLCLFQWNSVLAVTYPARDYGIKRGDSWDDVAAKMKGSDNNNDGTIKNECYTIHLPILGDAEDNKPPMQVDESIEASYRRIFELSNEEQLNCLRQENGRRRFHHQGKACLERYRLASMRIFSVVLESLQKRVTHECGYSFVLERASIDEFYLDLTEYCYQLNPSKDWNGSTRNDNILWKEKTVVAGRNGRCIKDCDNTDDPLEVAMNRAAELSYQVRQDIWNALGFTMSAGISTNKTMAKLAASYGKPNGQAVLYPNCFRMVLANTKITKLRNFGGKLGKTALKLLLQYQNHPTSETESDALERLKATATMADLNQIPLPFLLQSKLLSKESAEFIFFCSQGIDHEPVKETSGALVKSITAFKSFTATKSHAEIFDRWLNLLAAEIVERVARDSTRNKRYPKSCTLTYAYYTTSNGQRPSLATSSRSQRQSRTLRLRYPSEREGQSEQKISCLLAQAKEKLIPIVKEHPLTRVGLSVSNFDASQVHQQQGGSIESFFCAKDGAEASKSIERIPLKATASPKVELETSKINHTDCSLETATKKRSATFEDKDLDYARKLQASFDRENYVLSTANRRRKKLSNVKKTQRIDAFFKKR